MKKGKNEKKKGKNIKGMVMFVFFFYHEIIYRVTHTQYFFLEMTLLKVVFILFNSMCFRVCFIYEMRGCCFRSKGGS